MFCTETGRAPLLLYGQAAQRTTLAAVALTRVRIQGLRLMLAVTGAPEWQ